MDDRPGDVHLGSGAVILQRRLHDELAGTTTSDEFAPQIWDEWNATTPRAQVDDGLAADAAFLAALDALSDDERDRFTFEMGPISVDFDGFVGLRLNEHALHTWDIDVALNDAATIPTPIAALVVDQPRARRPLHREAHRGRPGDDRLFEPPTPTGTSPSSSRPRAPPSHRRRTTTGEIDVEMPAEAFVRLVYGRLSPIHTPPLAGDPAMIDRLRATYPGP